MSVKKAVSFACSLLKQGKGITEAVRIASGYYKVDKSAVHSGVSARSGRSQKGKPRKVKPKRLCESCGKAEAKWRWVGIYGAPTAQHFVCDGCADKYPSWWDSEGFDEIVRRKYTATKVQK